MKREKPAGFGIIGLGRFGLALAKNLAESGAEVLAIDSDENKLRQVRSYVHEAFRIGKLTNEALEESGIGACESVIVCMGEQVAVSMLTTLNVLNLGVPRVIAKADSLEHGMILERIGAEAVRPEVETATRLAAVLLESRAIDMMRLNDGYVISEIKVGSRLEGKTVKELLLDKYDLKLVALEKEPDMTICDCLGEEVLEMDDAILVLGKFADAERFQRKAGS